MWTPCWPHESCYLSVLGLARRLAVALKRFINTDYFKMAKYKTTMAKHYEGKIFNCLVTTVSVMGLTPLGTMISVGRVMACFESLLYTTLAFAKDWILKRDLMSIRTYSISQRYNSLLVICRGPKRDSNMVTHMPTDVLTIANVTSPAGILIHLR